MSLLLFLFFVIKNTITLRIHVVDVLIRQFVDQLLMGNQNDRIQKYRITTFFCGYSIFKYSNIVSHIHRQTILIFKLQHLRRAFEAEAAAAELFAEVISHCRSNGLLIYSPLAGKHSWRNKWNANAIFYIEEPLVLTIVFYRPENAFYGNFIAEKPFQSNADNLKHVFHCSPCCS